MKKVILSAFVSVFLIAACSKGGDDGGGGNSGACAGISAQYAANVSPIISSTCATNAGCHGSGSTHGPGELLTYGQIFAARTNIKTAVGNGTMPQTGSLTATQKNTIICWIDNGAPNN